MHDRFRCHGDVNSRLPTQTHNWVSRRALRRCCKKKKKSSAWKRGISQAVADRKVLIIRWNALRVAAGRGGGGGLLMGRMLRYTCTAHARTRAPRRAARREHAFPPEPFEATWVSPVWGGPGFRSVRLLSHPGRQGCDPCLSLPANPRGPS